MKKIIIIISLFISSFSFACGGGGIWEGMDFYNLFMQTNISAEEFYPFLRNEYNHFYSDNYYDNTELEVYPKGNITLWNKILTNWSKDDIKKAVYKFKTFNWNKYNSTIEKETKTYLSFAQECSDVFSYRYKRNSWDYDEAIDKKEIHTQELLAQANLLLNNTNNQQIKNRYHYQIIRILHYSKEWADAISYFENNIENKLDKNEIYYYMLDQVAGCYYSTGNFNKAGYLFTKVLNRSVDRKKSAFNSFLFCAMKDYEDGVYVNGIEDEKDFLLIKSLNGFSDEISNIRKFITLDANDNRVELLFMRALSNVERDVWVSSSYDKEKELPDLSESNHLSLLKITDLQIKNTQVKNKDFWKLCSSYLFFINQDIPRAKTLLQEVKTFDKQKKILAILYEVFSWKTISTANENYINKVLLNNPSKKNNWYSSEFDWRKLLLDKIARTYFENNKIAKAFLVHNSVSTVDNLQSITLLNRLEAFYLKPNKSDYEKTLIKKSLGTNIDYLDYINFQKGVYYLYDNNPKLALKFFNKNKWYTPSKTIPALIFSNNIKECFDCPEDEVMEDRVYKASAFKFIKKSFSRKDLAKNILQLQELIKNGKKWEIKLANYLLGNYYFNISNTGYYRGLLTDNTNCCHYIDYSADNSTRQLENIIKNKKKYNLADISFFEKHYFGTSNIATAYYNKTINLSTDKELNARCLYLIAKCELNDLYNLGNANTETFKTKISDYYTLELPQYKSFKILKNNYQDTEFYDMIIGECSYFRMYCNQ